MHGDIYYMQQHVKQLKDWSKDYHHNIHRYASWLNYVLDEYYFKHYDQYGKPRSYSYGTPTRGDFNYAYYYWVRPLYKKLISYAHDYYREYGYKNGRDHKVREYKVIIKEVVNKYHRLARCNYGVNGDDTRATDDNEVFAQEDDLGIDM